MPQHLAAVASAAQNKFGNVLFVTLKESATYGEFYHVGCFRANTPSPRPLMTITAKYDLEFPGEFDGNRVSFFSGHYDLTPEEFKEALVKNMTGVA